MMIYFGKRPLGRNIRRLRHRQRLSGKKLARMVGMPRLTLLRIELGILREIHSEHLIALAHTLGTKQKELMG